MIFDIEGKGDSNQKTNDNVRAQLKANMCLHTAQMFVKKIEKMEDSQEVLQGILQVQILSA